MCEKNNIIIYICLKLTKLEEIKENINLSD